MTPEWRAQFDAEITFSNGGGVSVHDFRLDIPGDTITEPELGEYLVRHLGLLMVDTVTVSNVELIREPHKGSRGREAADRPERAVVDLSHPVRDGMITYPGLPGPEIGAYRTRAESRASYAPGTEFHLGRISMVANTGTYLDTAFHRFADGADLAALPLSASVDLAGLVVRVTGAGERAVDRAALLPHEVRGRAVLIHTGWDRHWGAERYGAADHPYLTGAGAEWLVEQGAALVGIDSVNIDDIADTTRPAHTALLAAGIPIVEHLRGLDALPPDGFRFHAAPPAVEGLGTFPVRAYALVGL
ncbi:MAG: cyclase family protein [Mycobacteriales bacterium]